MEPYTVRLTKTVHQARKDIPAKVRQALVGIIDSLAANPQPNTSKVLDPKDQSHTKGWEIRRIRHTDWRVIFAIHQDWKEVLILAIRQRPPYSYDDLADLLSELG